MLKYREIRKESIRKSIENGTYLVGVGLSLDGTALQNFRYECLKRGLRLEMVERNFVKYIVNDYSMFSGNSYIVLLKDKDILSTNISFVEKYLNIFYVIINNHVYSYKYVMNLLEKRASNIKFENGKVTFFKNKVVSGVSFLKDINLRKIQKLDRVKRNGEIKSVS